MDKLVGDEGEEDDLEEVGGDGVEAVGAGDEEEEEESEEEGRGELFEVRSEGSGEVSKEDAEQEESEIDEIFRQRHAQVFKCLFSIFHSTLEVQLGENVNKIRYNLRK